MNGGQLHTMNGQQAAFTTQPGMPAPPGLNQIWMEKPAGNGDTPPGLEYLGLVDRVQIKQIKELAEIVLGWETTNKYVVLNGVGQQMLYVFEESGCCTRQCCGNQRGFTLHVVDNYKNEIMKISREFSCFAGCCWCAVPGSCCSHEVIVEAPVGHVIGTIQQRTACCSNSYVVNDRDGTRMFDLEGPCCCMMNFCQDKVYPVKTMAGVEVGEVRKSWAGILQEAFTDADNFGVSFPMDLAIRSKATLIGATFLIDFMNFEQPNQNN